MSAYFLQTFISTNIRFKKNTTQGWRVCNGVCCIHNGETADTRGRAGFRFLENGGLIHNCFNCGYKVVWQPGQSLTVRFKKLLVWFGIPEAQIDMLNFQALELRLSGEYDNTRYSDAVQTDFNREEYPESADYIDNFTDSDITTDFIDAIDYIANRHIDLKKYNFLWSPSKKYDYNRRIIIPFYYKEKFVGWSARHIDNVKTNRFVMQKQPGYVFNLNNQLPKSKVILVCEGVVDAMTLDCVSVLHNTVSDSQAGLIESYGKDVIVVPDFEKSGESLMEAALEYGWGVSFPVWGERYKDINEAVCVTGSKIFVMQEILKSVETNPLKIKLLARNAFKDKK